MMDWQTHYKECLLGHTTPAEILAQYDEETMLQEFSDLSQMPIVKYDDIELDFRILKHISLYQMNKFCVIPYRQEKDSIYLASLNPLNPIMRENLRKAFKEECIFCWIRQEDFSLLLEQVKREETISQMIGQIFLELQHKKESELGQHSSLMNFILFIFEDAITLQSSDIHIEVINQKCVIRFRVDGFLLQRFCLDENVFSLLCSRLKLLANLDISERRKGQDGRFSLEINVCGQSIPFDFRISTMPLLEQESIVIRILDKGQFTFSLDTLGISPYNVQIIKNVAQKHNGIIFITGPTGSGKTTTLYALIQHLNNGYQKIISIEDPIEYQLQGVSQVLINEKIQYGFSVVLRNILRQDPDVIMIGEIRDQETLRLALQASLTGHLVLSSLHTNDSFSGITRLLDMGIEPYFIAESVLMIEAQRLLKRLCPHCRYSYTLKNSENPFGLGENEVFFKSTGCHHCNKRGFKGREIITESLVMNAEIQEAVLGGANRQTLLQISQKYCFRSLFDDGVRKAKQGLVTLEELYRVVL
ncbi:hypothetical protein CCZ01_08305 [Helicobacter monodelphidis]|uniref:GspE/PulE family protein n=1 Tax=Helicobacter sp. 15-1451 TaxID=2004995 RepID=UPI000DCC7274|nr:GspE/PulE family protein [Helicobacter sp. 15-1451]RAX56850.1 hypothetical protein CCZ01_08305 [Helicobacter sp. 15-1451]